MQTHDITHAHLPYNNILIKIVVQHGCKYFVDNIVRENIIKDLLINFLGRDEETLMCDYPATVNTTEPLRVYCVVYCVIYLFKNSTL